jgi:hypothetical protein
VTRLLLSPTEQAYVNGTRDFSKAQQRYLGYRIKKKFSRLGVAAAAAASECRDAAAASRDGPNGLVAQPGYYYIEKNSLGRELNPRPLPLYGGKILLFLPYQGNALPG